MPPETKREDAYDGNPLKIPPATTIDPTVTISTIGNNKVVILKTVSSPANARRFVPIFDYAIENFGTKGNMFIPCSAIVDTRTGKMLQPDTARHRMGDALAYLMQFELDGNGPRGKYKIEDYARLRQSIRMKLGSRGDMGPGVLIEFKQNLGVDNDGRNILANAIVNVLEGEIESGKDTVGESTTSSSELPLWRQRIDQFLEDGSAQFLILTGQKQLGAILKVADIEFVKRIALQGGLEYEVSSTMIKLGK